jgi:hypothetical protein
MSDDGHGGGHFSPLAAYQRASPVGALRFDRVQRAVRGVASALARG